MLVSVLTLWISASPVPTTVEKVDCNTGSEETDCWSAIRNNIYKLKHSGSLSSGIKNANKVGSTVRNCLQCGADGVKEKVNNFSISSDRPANGRADSTEALSDGE